MDEDKMMQDKIFETFQRLLEDRDPELMKILKADREPSIPVRSRQRPGNQGGLGFGVIHMVTIQRDFDTVREDIVSKLQRLQNDPNCNKGDILKELSNDIGWQGVGQLFLYLLKERGSEDLIPSDNQLELHSARKPQYGIKVIPYKDYGSGRLGYFDVVMYDCADENIQTSIDFETQIQKVLYVWFLLHPRQKIQLYDFEKIILDNGQYPQLLNLAKSLYKEGGKFAKRYFSSGNVEGRKYFLKDFNSLKSNIATHVENAWKKIGGRGIVEWYTIQSEGKREANENSMSYFINLLPGKIKFTPCRIKYGQGAGTIDLEKCRMGQGLFPSIADSSSD